MGTTDIDLQPLLDEFQLLGALKGAIGLVALCVFVAVRVYRLPFFQQILPPSLQWDVMKPGTKYGVLAALAAIGAILTGESQGLAAIVVVKMTIAAVLSAVVADRFTQSDLAKVFAAGAHAATNIVVPPTPPSAPAP